MAVDLKKMLRRCRRGQWSVDDFDWSGSPVPLSPEKERLVCSYFLNMSYIERLAGALFLSLARRLQNPTLREIFETFHADELRHSHAAAKLADYFDVHHYAVYTPNVPMLRFIPYFVNAIGSLNPAFATSFILGGELVLDMSLLRGLNAYVDDPLSNAVVTKINKDESRHLAMDVYMTEYFARERWDEAGDNPWIGRDFWGLLTWGPGFFGEVFFRPMQVLDPAQDEMREVIRRLRRLYDRATLDGNPAVRQFRSVVAFFESWVGAPLGTGLESVIRQTTGIDLAFVHAASSENLYGAETADHQSAALAPARA